MLWTTTTTSDDIHITLKTHNSSQHCDNFRLSRPIHSLVNGRHVTKDAVQLTMGTPSTFYWYQRYTLAPYYVHQSRWKWRQKYSTRHQRSHIRKYSQLYEVYNKYGFTLFVPDEGTGTKSVTQEPACEKVTLGLHYSQCRPACLLCENVPRSTGQHHTPVHVSN